MREECLTLEKKYADEGIVVSLKMCEEAEEW